LNAGRAKCVLKGTARFQMQEEQHGLIGNVVTEILECTGDAIVSPAAILASQADDEFSELTSDGRSSRIKAFSGAIKLLSA
jgi:hypothetical protein